MKYITLLEFCELMIATRAGDSELANLHVKPEGYIEKAWSRVLDAIHREEDFDIRVYMQSLVDSSLDTAKKKLLH